MGIIVSQCESIRGSLKTNLNGILAEALLIVVVLLQQLQWVCRAMLDHSHYMRRIYELLESTSTFQHQAPRLHGTMALESTMDALAT